MWLSVINIKYTYAIKHLLRLESKIGKVLTRLRQKYSKIGDEPWRNPDTAGSD